MVAGRFDDPSGDIPELPRRRFSGKRIALFIVLPVLVVFGAIGALWTTGALERVISIFDRPEAETVSPVVFYDLPDLLVNLSSDGPRQNFLKISVSLELAREQDRAAIEQVLPRVVDSFQVYLRELRIEDLQGSAGIYRLREELLTRINAAAHPVDVRDVLFREMLVQ